MPERVYLLGKQLSIHKIFTFTQYAFDRLFHTPSRFYQDERAFLHAICCKWSIKGNGKKTVIRAGYLAGEFLKLFHKLFTINQYSFIHKSVVDVSWGIPWPMSSRYYSERTFFLPTRRTKVNGSRKSATLWALLSGVRRDLKERRTGSEGMSGWFWEMRSHACHPKATVLPHSLSRMISGEWTKTPLSPFGRVFHVFPGERSPISQIIHTRSLHSYRQHPRLLSRRKTREHFL